MYITPRNLYRNWNYYLHNIHKYTYIQNTDIQTITLSQKELELFDKIYRTGIDGRNLELCFPLLLISERIGMLDKMIGILKTMITEKKEEEVAESKDVMVFHLVSGQEPDRYYQVSLLTNSMRFMLHDESVSDWLNNHWMGKALKRLNLITAKRRTSEGQNVMLDVEKAKKMMQMFKSSDDLNKQEVK